MDATQSACRRSSPVIGGQWPVAGCLSALVADLRSQLIDPSNRPPRARYSKTWDAIAVLRAALVARSPR